MYSLLVDVAFLDEACFLCIARELETSLIEEGGIILKAIHAKLKYAQIYTAPSTGWKMEAKFVGWQMQAPNRTLRVSRRPPDPR